MRGPSGRTSLPSFVAVGHLLREIIATSGSYYGGNGAQYVPVSVPSATLSPEAVTLRRRIALLHAWPLGPNKSAKFRRCGSPTPRDNRDFQAPIMGNGANTCQLAYLRRHFTGSGDTETPHCTFGMRWPIGPQQVCQVSSLWVTYSER
ncbi:hypothetical protein DPMN_032037 [Dreissena polymorpha]|uniref:Uncharacterized protein n=1 Tax=Dreissena polymorpha TaxID=45954 RepID=A0A9D4M244_DREPO|nr:hypothetical protein DPMN_032037 [Dreissena polymorpha]